MNDEALEEWREHPVTIEIKDALAEYLDWREKSALGAYWHGSPISEEARLAIRGQMDLWGLMFNSNAADFNQWNDREPEDD
jgi:hypothetical protein